MKQNNEKGFTIIELMMVTAIIAILAAFALPAYKNYRLKAHRSEGKNLLMQVASREEQYYMNNKQYTATLGSGGLGFNVDTNGKVDSEGGTYKVSAVATTTSFTLSAVPQGAQTSDSCGTLTLDSTGQKGAATTGCW